MTIKINIEFNVDNAAFDDFHGQEVQRVIRNTADRIALQVTDTREIEPSNARIKDSNGNCIGTWSIQSAE